MMMSDSKNNLEKFLQQMADNASIQESLKQKAQQATTEAELNQLLCQQAQSEGYSVDAADVDLLIQNVKASDMGAELTDESLEQVNGGSIILGTIALITVIGSAAGIGAISTLLATDRG